MSWLCRVCLTRHVIAMWCSCYGMPFKKLPPGVKRVSIHLNLDPKTVARLREMSVEAGAPVSRVIDEMVLGSRAPGVSVRGSGVDLEAVIKRLREKQG